jgi:hypothetical protein
MDPRKTSCRVQSSRVVARLVLGLAVLMWGTAYKVSLYPRSGSGPERNQEQVPQAKLLTESERPARTARLGLPIASFGPAISPLPDVAALAAVAAPLLRLFVLLAGSPPRFPRCRAHESGFSVFSSLPPPVPGSSPSLS